LDAKYNADRQALSNRTAQALAADDNRVTEERRANYARDIGLIAQRYAAEAAIAQENVSRHLTFLAREAQDENLSWQERTRFAKEAFDLRQRLEDQEAARAKALGQETVTDELARLAQRAASYGADAEKRIEAETIYVAAVERAETFLHNAIKASGQLTVAD